MAAIDIPPQGDRTAPGASGLNRRQLIIAASILLVLVGMNNGIQALPLAVPALTKAWSVEPQALALAMSMSWLGMAGGSALGGLMADRIGRLPTLLAGGAIGALLTLLTAWADSPMQITALRVAAGLGFGAILPCGIALLTECLPPARRGAAVSAALLAGPVGFTLSAILAGALLPLRGWEAVFILAGCALGAAILLLALMGLESPRFLAMDPRRHLQLERVQRLLGFTGEEDKSAARSGESEEDGAGLSLFKPPLLGPGIRAWLSFFSTSFVLGSLLGWLPTVLASVGYPPTVGGSAIAFWSIGGIVGTIVSGYAIGRWSARVVCRVSPLIVFVALGVLVVAPGAAGGSTLILTMMTVVGFGISSLMTALYAFAAGYYPAALRASGLGIADMIGRAASVIASLVAVYLFEATGLRGFFLILALLSVTPAALMFASRQPAGSS